MIYKSLVSLSLSTSMLPIHCEVTSLLGLREEWGEWGQNGSKATPTLDADLTQVWLQVSSFTSVSLGNHTGLWSNQAYTHTACISTTSPLQLHQALKMHIWLITICQKKKKCQAELNSQRGKTHTKLTTAVTALMSPF